MKSNLRMKYYLKEMNNITNKSISISSVGACYHIDGYNFIIDSKYEKQFKKLIALYQKSMNHSLKMQFLTFLASLSVISSLVYSENINFDFNHIKLKLEQEEEKSFSNGNLLLVENINNTTNMLYNQIENRVEQIENMIEEYDVYILNCANDLNLPEKDTQKIIRFTHELINTNETISNIFLNKIRHLENTQGLHKLLLYLQYNLKTQNNPLVTEKISEIEALKELVIKMKNRKNRVYYDIPTYDQDFQDFIYDTSITYNVPYKIGFILGELESGGSWKSNGLISNGNYGLTQINRSNLSYIQENYGYGEDEVLNNHYINMECCIRLLHDVYLPACNYNENNICYEEIFGTYNRWVIWKDYPEACEYVEEAMHLLNTKYSADFIKEEINENQILKKIQK